MREFWIEGLFADNLALLIDGMIMLFGRKRGRLKRNVFPLTLPYDSKIKQH
jgi:hypothetical protein